METFETDKDLFSLINETQETTEQPVVQQEQPKRGRPKKVEQPTQNVNNETTEEVKEEEPSLFDIIDEEVETKPAEKPSQNKTGNSVYSSAIDQLKTLGVFDYDLEEGTVMNEHLAKEIFEDQFDTLIDNRVKNLFEDLPEEVRMLNNYVLNGGNFNDFISIMQENRNITGDIDLTEIENQEMVVREMLKRNNKYLSADNIETQIEMLKDAGKLYEISVAELEGIKQEERRKQEELLAMQEEQYRQRKEQIRQAKASVLDYVSKNQEIAGVKFKKGDRETLPTYLHDKTIKLQDGSFITEFEKDLYYEVMSNPVAVMQLATLLKHRNKDNTLNFDSIYQQAQTQVTRQLQDNVRRKQEGVPVAPKYRRLEDYF